MSDYEAPNYKLLVHQFEIQRRRVHDIDEEIRAIHELLRQKAGKTEIEAFRVAIAELVLEFAEFKKSNASILESLQGVTQP